MDTADKIDVADGNYDEHGHSPKYGHGRINAHAAIKKVIGSDEVVQARKTLFIEHRIKAQIPDLGEITDSVSVFLNENIKELEVNIEIKHTWRGDLSISLLPPETEEIILSNRTGSSADDFIRTFRSSDQPAIFQGLINKPAKGDWKLRVSDNAQNDVGVLNKWGIAITY